MAFIASDNGGGDFKRVPAGVFIGRCYSLIDIGTQRVEFQGDVKLQHKIIIRWELFGEDEHGEPLTIDVDGKAMPMTISKRYTLSLSDKARLRHDLVSWRGRDFTDEEAKAFDVSKLIGAYCMVNVTQNESNGKVYSNISSLTPLPGALKNAKPDPVHENRMFDLDSPDWDFFETLHEKLRETIKESTEWISKYGKPSGAKEYADVTGGAGFHDDDIPF
ncbi:hypothetical protein PEP31012_03677 [Pandoraea eparura]|uniref:Uncharacterized protein n=1 Tax=Pandoraea eparura TaxID=2508291 RepID=A0A5E4X3V3_9BURK|nr:hypothetical protein [Pandoraea eparura]VVE31031.1 hypothetical protein PEP31012_03677 [Pandoraea eparura]